MRGRSGALAVSSSTIEARVTTSRTVKPRSRDALELGPDHLAEALRHAPHERPRGLRRLRDVVGVREEVALEVRGRGVEVPHGGRVAGGLEERLEPEPLRGHEGGDLVEAPPLGDGQVAPHDVASSERVQDPLEGQGPGEGVLAGLEPGALAPRLGEHPEDEGVAHQAEGVQLPGDGLGARPRGHDEPHDGGALGDLRERGLVPPRRGGAAREGHERQEGQGDTTRPAPPPRAAGPGVPAAASRGLPSAGRHRLALVEVLLEDQGRRRLVEAGLAVAALHARPRRVARRPRPRSAARPA